MCVISSWIPQQTKRMRFIIDGQKYDFSVFEVRSIGEAAKDHKNALNLERIRYAAHLAKKYHHGTSAHHMVLIKTAIFPLLFQCFTRALRDLASFYPLLSVSTVVINFPSVLLKFAIAFPFFSHCSLFIPNFRMKIALLTKFGQKLNFCTSHVCHLLISKLQFFHCFSITR